MDVPLSRSLTVSAKQSRCHSGYRKHLAELEGPWAPVVRTYVKGSTWQRGGPSPSPCVNINAIYDPAIHLHAMSFPNKDTCALFLIPNQGKGDSFCQSKQRMKSGLMPRPANPAAE